MQNINSNFAFAKFSEGAAPKAARRFSLPALGFTLPCAT
jgi:hypothetical protein